MRIWEPWETAWPAGAALLLLLGAAVAARRQLRLPRAEWLPVVGVFLLALGVRLFFIPAWWEHQYDGHEAELFDLFRGERVPNRGGTVLYPAMQWLWWGLGQVLPRDERVPVVVMAVVGSLSALVVGAAVGRIAEGRDSSGHRAALVAALFVALHPVHAAWSSSAYNVILPFFFGSVTLWAGAVVGTRRHPPIAIALLGAAAWALTVATRMEAALIGLPAFLLALCLRPEGARWADLAWRRLVLIGPLALGLLLGGFALYPLVYPGEIPGAGERGLAFSINLPMLGYHHPVLPGLFLALSGILGLLALRRWPAPTLILAVGVLANHLLLATFDDLGDRHLLTALPGLAWMVAAGALSTRRAGLLLVPLFLLLGAGLLDLRGRYYASEESFAVYLDQRWPELPRVPLEDARQGCGWINEDPRAAADPVASHFNVLDPAEARSLRGSSGCLRWCSDVQDWRWSSRAVADRAQRMHRLYGLEPVAVVDDRTLGYACLVWEVGQRRCCGRE